MVLTAKVLDDYRGRLEAMLVELDKVRISVTRDLTDSPNHTEESESPDPNSTNSSDLRDHQPDQQVALGSLIIEENIEGEIGDALKRIQNGMFGRCERCGKSIDKKRLQVIPYARCCISCAKSNPSTI